MSEELRLPRIEVLVGMIGSGKSTYARERADAGAIVVSHDALTSMLHARYRYEAELRRAYRRMEESIALVASSADRDVVVDRTHLTRESRRRWVEFGYSIGTPVVAVAFPVMHPRVHAERRFNDDPRGRTLAEWSKVALHHGLQATAEPLDGPLEGFAAVEYRRGVGPALPVLNVLRPFPGRSSGDNSGEVGRG